MSNYYDPLDSLPSGWSASGTPTYTSGLYTTFDFGEYLDSGSVVSSTDTLWATFEAECGSISLTAGQYANLLEIYDTADSLVGKVAVSYSSGQYSLHAYHGTESDSTTVPGLGYLFFWVKYTSTGDIQLWVGSTGDYSAATLYADVSGGDGGTNNVDRVRFGYLSNTGTASGSVSFGSFRVDSQLPGDIPTSPSATPSSSPSSSPSTSPSSSPSDTPSSSPSAGTPSTSASDSPSATPSAGTGTASSSPSSSVSSSPSATPSTSASDSPSSSVSDSPSATPSSSVSDSPSSSVSDSPSATPSGTPSSSPSDTPSSSPSASPTEGTASPSDDADVMYAVSNNGYAISTRTNAQVVMLPANPSVDDTIGIVDYHGTFGTTRCWIHPNGKNLQGRNDYYIMDEDNESVELTYIDDTQGWLVTG